MGVWHYPETVTSSSIYGFCNLKFYYKVAWSHGIIFKSTTAKLPPKSRTYSLGRNHLNCQVKKMSLDLVHFSGTPISQSPPLLSDAAVLQPDTEKLRFQAEQNMNKSKLPKTNLKMPFFNIIKIHKFRMLPWRLQQWHSSNCFVYIKVFFIPPSGLSYHELFLQS